MLSWMLLVYLLKDMILLTPFTVRFLPSANSAKEFLATSQEFLMHPKAASERQLKVILTSTVEAT